MMIYIQRDTKRIAMDVFFFSFVVLFAKYLDQGMKYK
jgi:hypothetical protein